MRKGKPLLVVMLPLALARCMCGGPPPDECATEDDCEGGAVCVRESDGHRVCAAVCGAETPCPEGRACVEDDGFFACILTVDDIAVGEPCDDDTACASGACVGDAEAGFFCAAVCVSDGDCQGGERCYVADHRMVCLEPIDDRAAGESCDTPRQCASARCVMLAEGDEGSAVCLDGCAESDECGGEQRCVELNTGAHVCIDTVADGTPCTDGLRCRNGLCIVDEGAATGICTGPCGDEGACAGDWSCVDDDEGNPICMPPLDDRAAGEECSSRRECASGYCGSFAVNAATTLVICADPCDESGQCADDELLCWETAEGPDLCGPVPG